MIKTENAKRSENTKTDHHKTIPTYHKGKKKPMETTSYRKLTTNDNKRLPQIIKDY